MSILKIMSKIFVFVLFLLWSFQMAACNSVGDKVDLNSDSNISPNTIDNEVTINESDNEIKDIYEEENVLGNSEHLELSEYVPLLEGEKTFYCFFLEDDCNLNESFEEDFSLIDYALVDMDLDGNEELLIETNLGPGMTFVITIIDGEYYGSYYSGRELAELQKNGNFIGSGGAADTYFCRMNKITKDGIEIIHFAEKTGWGEECNWSDGLYEEFLQVNYSDPVEWKKF